MIDTTRGLAAVMKRAREAGRVALDTEFVWEKTYYPRLGLVQVGLPGPECHLVDTPAISDLSPLGELLADEDTEKVLHDAQQDLSILRLDTGRTPRCVFDTRLAGGFAGMGASTSLVRLIHALVGVELSKDAQRTNWLKRPLSARQVTYAENDVRHLLEARDLLMERVEERGNGEWLRQEFALMDDPTRYEERDVRGQYLRIKAASRLKGMPLAVLRELAAYREQEARRRDLPRGWLFNDAALLAMARQQPTTLDELSGLKGISARAVQHRGRALLEAVARAAALPQAEWPTPLQRPGSRKVRPDELDAALKTVERRCEPRGIDPAMVASRTELRALLGGDRDSRLLVGWRAELVGRELVGGRG